MPLLVLMKDYENSGMALFCGLPSSASSAASPRREVFSIAQRRSAIAVSSPLA